MNSFGRSAFGVMMAAGVIANPWLARAEEPVRFSAGSGLGPPFAEYGVDGALNGGLMLEIIEAIARETGLKWRIVTLPRQRVDDAIDAKEIDVRCYIRPEWTRSPGSYFWSAPIFTQRDVVIGRKGQPPIASFSEFAGRSVTTVLGYRYPRAEEFLERSEVVRHIVPTERNVAMMVALGRSDLGIINDIVLGYMMRTEPARSQIEIAPIPADRRDILCGVRRDFDAPRAKAVLSAIEDLGTRGEFLRILSPTQ